MRISIRPWFLILAVALAYGLAQFGWYAGTPLGRVPVLDEHENLALVEQVANGTLPHEPFYRAMGYPLFLASLRIAGITAAQLPLAALLVGVALHTVVALLIAALARRWFDDSRAEVVAGLLAALNPVLVDAAMQRLDGTLGMVLFLAGLVCLSLECDQPGWRRLLFASGFWGLAALTRPQYLSVWLVLPLVSFVPQRSRSVVVRSLAATAIAGALFVAQGWWQRDVCGEFRILPWQGPYNLWAANRPGANGYYYQQTLNLAYSGSSDNPARLESIVLYRAETGRSPDEIDTMNLHWRQRFAAHVIQHPGSWLWSMTKKAYALLNDWEQYNNKTYAFQKGLSPWLRLNPLGWGVLLVLGIAGAWRLHDRAAPVFGAVATVAAASAAGVLLFYVSGRFRIPLAGLLCVLAGGALSRPIFWRAFPPSRRWGLAALLLAAASLTFSAFASVRNVHTIIQDRLLIAYAAQLTGDEQEAWNQSRAAASLDPGRADAHEFVVTSGFNCLLAGGLAEADMTTLRRSARSLLANPGAGAPGSRVIAAALDHNAACLRACAGGEDTSAYDALGAIYLLGQANEAETTRLAAASWDAGTTLFLVARQAMDPAGFTSWAQVHSRSGRWVSALAALRQRLFVTAVGNAVH